MLRQHDQKANYRTVREVDSFSFEREARSKSGGELGREKLIGSFKEKGRERWKSS